eukprot:m.383655 g.383655  ORF g.383655 m.383655 type:complete len:294 (-) comp20982_c1_seq1:204-1085(-)
MAPPTPTPSTQDPQAHKTLKTRLREMLARKNTANAHNRDDIRQVESSDQMTPQLELQELTPPVDMKTLLEDLDRLGLRSISTKSGQSSISLARAAQLRYAPVITFLRESNQFGRNGLCGISSQEYDLLRDEARSWFDDPTKLPKSSTEADGPGGTLLHTVTAKDTLQGIAIRYDTTVSRLRKLNKLPAGRHLFERKEILVPTEIPDGSTPDPDVAEFRLYVRHEAMKIFTSKNECTESEAWCYLEFNDFDLMKADAEFAADAQWASGVPTAFPLARVVQGDESSDVRSVAITV